MFAVLPKQLLGSNPTPTEHGREFVMLFVLLVVRVAKKRYNFIDHKRFTYGSNRWVLSKHGGLAIRFDEI